ncbi:hypothetical protein [Sphaerisporangium sp. NPDC051011]|uniref:hypothetical protein n=1 Tax=Sphaerisporangium sp. NPDC051011 TaxID=3155792 RepID=UPI0033DDE9BC
MPPLLLLQQMIGPMLMHFLTRPTLENVPQVALPDIATTHQEFARVFLRAVAVDLQPPTGEPTP